MAKICLDAGHYGKYNRSPVVPAYYESNMNWKLHNKLADELNKYGIDVVLTRSSKDKDLALVERGRKSKGCDLFLSIHSNACNTESVDNPMSCCLIDDNKSKLDEASKEIGLKLAQTVANVMDTKGAGRIMQRKGNQGDYYGVLRGAKEVGTVAVLLEHSYHTNTRATNWLLVDSNLDKLAKAEAKVLAEWLGVKAEDKEEDNKLLYRVQVGAFSNKDNADAYFEKVEQAGFPVYMVEYAGLYKIQVGAYRERANAVAQCEALESAGFDAYITTRSGNAVSTKKTIDEVAREVLQGKWGNGSERKRRLTQAGYDYNAVQERVNELL